MSKNTIGNEPENLEEMLQKRWNKLPKKQQQFLNELSNNALGVHASLSLHLEEAKAILEKIHNPEYGFDDYAKMPSIPMPAAIMLCFITDKDTSIKAEEIFKQKKTGIAKKAANEKHKKHSLPIKQKIEDWYYAHADKNKSSNKLAEDAIIKLDNVSFTTARDTIRAIKKKDKQAK